MFYAEICLIFNLMGGKSPFFCGNPGVQIPHGPGQHFSLRSFCYTYAPAILLSLFFVTLNMIAENDRVYLREAIALAREGIGKGKGGPFGCVVVRDGQVIGRGYNLVTSTNDPTAHAEVVAIRDACNKLGNHQLTDCDIYASCEPCPMCLGAIYWARPRRVIYASTRLQAADAGFDDDLIYREINLDPGKRQIPFIAQLLDEATGVFDEWKNMGNKNMY
jgi:guanine deaminase